MAVGSNRRRNPFERLSAFSRFERLGRLADRRMTGQALESQQKGERPKVTQKVGASHGGGGPSTNFRPSQRTERAKGRGRAEERRIGLDGRYYREITKERFPDFSTFDPHIMGVPGGRAVLPRNIPHGNTQPNGGGGIRGHGLNSPVTRREFERYDFEPEGPEDEGKFLRMPRRILPANRIKTEIEEKMRDPRFGGAGSSDNYWQNAVKHALLSFRLTREFGPVVAKKITDAHERGGKETGAILIDLHNNEFGRRLAMNAAITDSDAAAIILQALIDGKLRYFPKPNKKKTKTKSG